MAYWACAAFLALVFPAGCGGSAPSESEGGEDPEEKLCEAGATRVVDCGPNGRGKQEQLCEDGVWVDEGSCDDPDECEDGTTERVDCEKSDLCVHERACVEGSWQTGPAEPLSIGTGPDQVCAVRDNGRVICWG